MSSVMICAEPERYYSSDVETTATLAALNAAYWRDVDCNWGRSAHGFFVAEGAVYTIHDKTLHGREEIRNFYAWRAARGSRVSRHCITNFCVASVSAGRAEADWVLLLYAADGEPILPTAAPIQIADVHDVCVRGADGHWRYASRNLTTLFAGGVPATLPR